MRFLVDRVVSEGGQLRQLINRLADFDGGVRRTREPQMMAAEFEKSKNAWPKSRSPSAR